MKNILLALAFLTLSAITSAAQIVVSAPQQAVQPGNFDVVINAGPLDNLISYQFDIYHDANVIAPTGGESENFGCTTQDTLASNLSVVCNGYEAGRLRVVVYGALPITGGSGAILRVHFHTVTSDAKSTLHFANGHFYLWPSGETSSTYQDGYIKVKP